MEALAFERPGWLYGLWALPLFAWLALRAHRKVRSAAERFLGATMRERLAPPLSARGPFVTSAAFILGIAALLFAIAGPSWDFDFVPVEARGIDVAVVFDVSRSMLADDGGETRLERARSAVGELVRGLVGDRVGLILFAGESVVTCPLTFDRGFFLAALREAAPGLAGRGGTLIGPALETAGRMLDASGDRDKVVLLVTDAGDQESFPRRAAEALAERRIRVLAVGVGRTNSEDEPLVIDGQVVRSKDGPVKARVQVQLLNELATITKGIAIPPEETHRLASIYSEYVAPLERGEAVAKDEKRPRARYQAFALLAFGLLLAQARVRPYPRRKAERKTANQSKLAGIALLALVLSGCGDRGAYEALREQWIAGQNDVQGFADLAAASDRPTHHLGLAAAAARAGELARAREAYGKALLSGDATLRARATAGLAALDVEEFRKALPEAPETVKGKAREELKASAERILDRWFRARELDPQFVEAAEREAAFEQYWRQLEATWEALDREARRAERKALPGRSFFAAVLAEQEAIVTGLAKAERLRANLALDQRALAEDVEELGQAKVEAEEGQPLEGVRAAVRERVEPLAQSLREAEQELLLEGQAKAPRALPRAALQAREIVLLWSSVGEALRLSEEVLRGFEMTLRALPSPAAQTLALREATESGLVEALGAPTRALVQRIDAEPEAPVNRARSFVKDQAEAVRQRIEQEVLGRAAEADPLPAIDALLASAEQLADAQVDWRLGEGPIADLPKSQGLALRALRDALGREQDQPAAEVARWKKLPTAVLRRLGYVPPRFEDALSELRAQGGERGAEEVREEEAARGVLMTLLDPALQAVRALEGELPPAARDAEIAKAREALQGVFSFLAMLDEALPAARADALALQQGLQALLRQDDEAALARALGQAPFRQQDLGGEADLLVRAVRDLSRVAMPRARAAAEAQAGEEPVDATTLDAVAAALSRAETAGAALAAAWPKGATGPSQRAFLELGADPLAAVVKALSEALEALERGRAPLVQLAQRIAAGAEPLAIAAHELIDGRSFGPTPEVAAQAPKERYEAELRPLIQALAGALRRFEREAAPKPPEGGGEVPREEAEAFAARKAALSELVTEINALDTPIATDLDTKPPKDESLLALRDRARVLWASLALSEFKQALQVGIDEQTRWLGWIGEDVPAEARRDARFGASERFTAGLIPLYERAVEALAEVENGPLKPEVIELARKNLPLAKTAMEAAALAIAAADRPLARTEATKARDLLREILDAMEEDQDGEDQQPQPQPAPAESEPNEPSANDSERLARAIEERARDLEQKERKTRPRPPVENDW